MKRSKVLSAFFFASAAAVLFSACESNRWFQSEDKLRSKIQTTWNKVLIPSTLPTEEWTFKEGKVYRLQGTQVDTIFIDVGNYSVSTSLTKAYLSISDFSRTADKLNAKWEIIELDKGLLYIATDHDGASGLLQREFTEK